MRNHILKGLILCSLFLSVTSHAVGNIDLVSINKEQTDSANNDSPPSSSGVSITPDGRFVLFHSVATDLVNFPVFNAQADQLYRRDLATNTTELVTFNWDNTDGNDCGIDATIAPQITPDGRYVVFSSCAENLTAHKNPNQIKQIYVRDMQKKETTLVSEGTDGQVGNGLSIQPKISDNGQVVVFMSFASNLAANDNNKNGDIFAKDLSDQNNKNIELISISTNGQSGNAGSRTASITPDGRYVAFISHATDLPPSPNVAKNTTNVYLRDRLDNKTELISISFDKMQGANQICADCIFPILSSDARYVLFRSTATNLVNIADNNLNNGGGDFFLRNRTQGTTTLITVNKDGTATGKYPSMHADMTPDGRFIVFESHADDLTETKDNNKTVDIFLKDMTTIPPKSILLSTSTIGDESANGASERPLISKDGKKVVFSTMAKNIVGTPDNNSHNDVVLIDLETKAKTLISFNKDHAQTGNNDSFHFRSMSADGRVIPFRSSSNDIVQKDTNGGNGNSHDVFVYKDPLPANQASNLPNPPDSPQINSAPPPPAAITPQSIKPLSSPTPTAEPDPSTVSGTGFCSIHAQAKETGSPFAVLSAAFILLALWRISKRRLPLH